MRIVGIVSLGNINGFSVEMIQNPKGLPKEQQEHLVRELNSISVDAFNKATPIEETWERTIGVDQIYLMKDDNRIVGYTTNDFMNLDGTVVNYFSSALFRREVQNHGLYKPMNALRLKTGKTDVIMTRTQNPMVVKGFRHMCNEHSFEAFPNGKRTPDGLLRIAKAYAPSVNNHLVCEGVYGRALMDDSPKPEISVNDVFQYVNVQKGDGLILFGRK